MADITMCRGEGCRQRRKCWRHLAKSTDERQSWFAKSPRSTLHCKYYMRPPQGWTKRGRS